MAVAARSKWVSGGVPRTTRSRSAARANSASGVGTIRASRVEPCRLGGALRVGRDDDVQRVVGIRRDQRCVEDLARDPEADDGGADGCRCVPSGSPSEHLREEALEAFALGVVEEVGGRAGLDDFAFVHEDDLVGDLAGEAHLVGDHQHGHAALGRGLP